MVWIVRPTADISRVFFSEVINETHNSCRDRTILETLYVSGEVGLAPSTALRQLKPVMLIDLHPEEGVLLRSSDGAGDRAAASYMRLRGFRTSDVKECLLHCI